MIYKILIKALNIATVNHWMCSLLCKTWTFLEVLAHVQSRDSKFSTNDQIILQFFSILTGNLLKSNCSLLCELWFIHFFFPCFNWFWINQSDLHEMKKILNNCSQYKWLDNPLDKAVLEKILEKLFAEFLTWKYCVKKKILIFEVIALIS